MAELRQTLVWVAVPSGYGDRGKLRLSVIAYPRLFVLENGGPAASTVPLSQFADFLHWPGVSEGVQFKVQFGTGAPVRASRVSRKPDMALWTLLFPKDMPVECYEQPRRIPQTTLAYPAASMHHYLKEQYTRAGQEHPWAPPLAETLAQNFGEVAPAIFLTGDRSTKLRQAVDTFDSLQYVDDRNYGKDRARDWLLTKLFFRPPKVERHLDGTASHGYVDPPEVADGSGDFNTRPEFHKMIAMLTFHFELLRSIGLIIDLEVERPAGLPPESTVRIVPTWNGGPGKVPTTHAAPATHYRATATSFLARERPHDPEDLLLGTVDLARPRYEVVQEELDGGAMALQQQVEYLSRKVGERVPLPPLSSGGLSLIRRSASQRQVEQYAQYNANYELRMGDPGKVDVYAEDLLMGYRLDIWSDRAARWHSLHKRVADYKFMGGSKPLLYQFQNEGWINPTMSEVDPGLVTENVMSPFLARWTGWSLSGHREPPDEVPVNPDLQWGVRYSVAPGTLPWLRFGITYRLRMRTVDMAGNGQAHDPAAPTEPGATQALTYRRFEPVAIPLLITKHPMTEGESVAQMVVRDTEPDAVSERHIAPPRTTVPVCEAHGLFDTATGMDAAKLEDAEEREAVNSPTDVPGATVPVEYLPDYLARGAALIDVPGAGGPVHVDFGTAWPQRQSFRVRLHGGSGAPSWNAGARELDIHLPPAETATVRLGSHFDQGDLETMALWHWLKEGLSGDRLAQLRQGILDGRHWQLTPGRDLQLVHAVQQPLESPDFVKVGALRGEGDTAATFSGVVKVHGKSTAKVAVGVSWVEPVDDVELEEPLFVSGSSPAFEVNVGSKNATTVDVENKFDFRDTKHRKVQLTATATSRFTDYYPEETDFERDGNPIEIDVLNTARPLAPKVQYVVPTFGWEQPPARPDGTITRIRWGGGLRVYLDRPWYSTGDGEMLAVILYDEKSRSLFRRPEVPEGVKPWVTIWGADPLWKSGDLPFYPRLEHFKSALVTQTGLQLPEAGGAPILVAGHAVKYDTQSKRWYADIEVDAGSSYFPFIRLALARFQPKSVGGAHLSPVVAADIAQIAPNRTVTVSRNGDKVSVALAGITFSAGRAGSAVVRVAVEAAGAQGGLLAWATTGITATLKREGAVWTGSVNLAQATEAARYRLVIREYERLLSDSGVTERLVYADTILI